MSTGERRKVSPEDIQMVQNLIEQCLAHYMTKEQVIDILHQQQNIEPGFTELVWQKLEEQNQEFFKIYRLRLVLTKQITEFNNLLRRQAALMKQLDPNGVAFQPVPNGSHIPASKPPVSNGSHIPPMHHSSTFFAFENNGVHMKLGNMQQQPVPTVLSSGFNNHGPSINSEMPHALDMFAQSRRLDVPLNMMLADQNSNFGSVQGMNRLAIKTEPGYLSNPSFAHQTGGHVMEVHPTMDFASTSSYHIMDSNSRQLNGTLLNTSYSDVLRNHSQSQNVGIPDTTSDFDSLDVQRFYMSAFPLPDGDNIWNHHDSRIENQGENRRLHDISGNLCFQNSG